MRLILTSCIVSGLIKEVKNNEKNPKTTHHFALITGASSGIGLATAQLLAAKGYELILIARRKDRLQKISSELSAASKVPVHFFTVDVCDALSVENFILSRQKLLSRVNVLINNAGLAKGADKVFEAKLTDFDQMIDTNIKGLLRFTRGLAPYFINQGHGHIVNIGSVAGRWLYPGGAVYCATKFAVRALTEGLRMDLAGTGVRVTNIEPGMVETEFSEVRFEDIEKAKKVYTGMQPLSAADIAETIVWTIERPQHVNVQELVIYPTDQASVSIVHRNQVKGI
jgi:3-hydroxy acid dehydrogenase / malonic semialdehyde reductase